MLFPKFVPSCSQSWALFCIWNVRNALLHSLSHLDTLTCKGCKENENTAGARTHLLLSAFTATVTWATGVSWAVAAAQPHAGPEHCLPPHSLPSEQKLHYVHVKVFSWLLSAPAALSCTGRGVTAPPSAAWPAQPKRSMSCTCAPQRTHTHLSCVRSSCWVGNGNQRRDKFSLWMWGKSWLWE